MKENSGNVAAAGGGCQCSWEVWGQKEKEERGQLLYGVAKEYSSGSLAV